MIYYLLPPELWAIVGDYICMDVAQHEDSLSVKIKPYASYAIVYPGDEKGEWFVEPCTIS